jgi:CRP/FNR family transcriptional regulator
MQKLNEIRIFSALGETDISEIEDYLLFEQLRKKEIIFSEGDASDWFYIVLEGKVKITKLSQDGKEIILEVISEGDFFGGIAVLRGFPYPANAVSMEDGKLIKISKANLMKIIDRFPEVMTSIFHGLGDRVKDFHEMTKNIALEKVSSRITALLLKLSEQTGARTPEGIVLDMKLTKQDIAEMVGTTVETAIRTMSRFKKLGLIEEKTGKIIVKDPEALKDSYQ